MSRTNRPLASADVDPLVRDLEELRRVIEPFQIEMSVRARTLLLSYARHLVSWNLKHNLMSRNDTANVIRRHVSASLGPLLLSPPVDGQKWMDVGSGAGFPGVVLAIVHPGIEMTLLDSSNKRCDFLEFVVGELGLNVRVIRSRAEDFLQDGHEHSIDVVTTKAVAAIRDCLRGFGDLVAPGGRFVTFKGPSWRDEVDAAERAGVLRPRFVVESAIRLPWTQAHLVSLYRDDHSP